MASKALLVAALAALGCGGSSTTSAPSAPEASRAAPSADDDLAKGADAFYWAHLDFRPQQGIELGYHDRYDGKVPDRSREAIAAEIQRLQSARAWLEGIDPDRLSPGPRLDREVLLAEVRRALFELAELQRPFREPLYYLLFDFSLSGYIDRDYAPLETRARGLLEACRKTPAYYSQMLSNLEPSLSRPAVQIATMMAGGTIALVDGAVRKEMAKVEDEALRADIDQCLNQVVAALGGVKAALGERMKSATDDFAIGEEMFLRMLAETQGIEIDLAGLERIGHEDLEKNLAAIRAAAAEIDPKRDPTQIIAEASSDKPDAGAVLAEATQQMLAMRAFVLEHDIASIPGTDEAEVRASPPHRRGNFAALSSAGPFESRQLPSYYYLAPPDPAWPVEQQRAYLPSRADLLFVTIHEVWPGHFLQGRHIAAYGSRYLKSFETYTTSEGWAHYVEEMMWEAGAGDRDPRMRIGQLKNALLRNVRFVVALGLHTGKMTVDEATQMFQDKAFADAQNARQQALRGTADPMYLSYTLGKLAIRKLHDDWKRARGTGYSLKAFHDEFLRHGEAPLPTIRRAMLGEGAGPVL